MSKEYKGSLIRDIPKGKMLKNKLPEGEMIVSEGPKGDQLWKNKGNLNENENENKRLNECV